LLAFDEVNSEQIESILAKLSEMGINVVETKEARPEEEVAAGEELEEEETEGKNKLIEIQQRSVPAKSEAKEPAERTDDPVRMYLREMASLQLPALEELPRVRSPPRRCCRSFSDRWPV
jgi:RNA polymerase primary sigma factor